MLGLCTRILYSLKRCLNVFPEERILVESNQLRHYQPGRATEGDSGDVTAAVLHREAVSAVEDQLCTIELAVDEVPTITDNLFYAKGGSNNRNELSSPLSH